MTFFLINFKKSSAFPHFLHFVDKTAPQSRHCIKYHTKPDNPPQQQ